MRWPDVFVALGVVAACSEGSGGPFDGLPLDGDFTVGVAAPVHVARDRHGVAHITADTIGDAAFVQGYVMAHDRLPQMDVLRRSGAGTLSELFGALDPGVIDSDLAIRVHRIKPLAQDTWAVLRASSDAADQEVVQLVQRFADGVNAYASDVRRGLWTIDPAIASGFDPARFVPWDPVDSLVIARFEAFSQSYSAPFEIDLTELYQQLRTTYDLGPATPAAVARRGISRDLLRFTPPGLAPTIPGFPNVAVDTGSRSDGSDAAAGGAARRASPAPAPVASAGRPQVPRQVFDSTGGLAPRPTGRAGGVPTLHLRASPVDDARSSLARPIDARSLAALAPHASGQPLAGGTSWAVGARIAGGGRVMLASDPHLPLTNPSLLYPIHLIVHTGALDVLGVTIPGVPGVMLGSNGHVAWSATASEHDVNDVYLEQIAPCGGTSCAAWTDPQGTARQVPLQTFTEQIQIGTLGTITDRVMATYEVVPHHGPIVPAIDHTRHVVVPRTTGAALSVRYTGDQPTFELRALYNLCHAGTVIEGFRALKDLSYGGQSWVLIDDQAHIGWTTQAYLPVRKPAAYTWNTLLRQDGLAPFFVLPGNGDGDWLEGHPLSPRFVPHAIDPAQGYLVAGSADPVGATFDGDPLDQSAATGEPLYAGISYAAGAREERITQLLQQIDRTGAGMTLDDLAGMLRDTHASAGAKLTPAIRTALARLDSPLGAPTDLVPYVASLSAADRARLDTARGLMTRWTFATPAAIDEADDDSAATAIFYTWLHCFIARTLADELDVIGFDVWRLDDRQLFRIVHAMLTDPRSFVPSPQTTEPILCDNYADAGPDDSCTKAILQSMVDAMIQLESPQGFATSDVTQWRWGKLHRLSLAAQRPDPALAVPAPGDATPAGFAAGGDSFVIDPSDPARSDLAYALRAGGPAERFVAEARPGEAISVKWALPGGVIYDTRSPHYRDLLDHGYLTDQLIDAPYSIDQIVRAGESRWVFH